MILIKKNSQKKIISPIELQNEDFGVILVLVGQKSIKEIYEQCLNLNFNMNKIIFLHDNFILQDLNKNYDLVEEILGKDYVKK